MVAHNITNGIVVGTGERNTIRGNSVFQNEGLGIDLGNSGVAPNDPGDGDGGSNILQNYPIITSVEPALVAGPQGASTRIRGFIRGAAATQLELDFFSNDSCADRPQEFLEGRTYLGSTTLTTDDAGFQGHRRDESGRRRRERSRLLHRHRSAGEHLRVLTATAALRLPDIRDAVGRNEPVDHRHRLPVGSDGHHRRRRRPGRRGFGCHDDHRGISGPAGGIGQ